MKRLCALATLILAGCGIQHSIKTAEPEAIPKIQAPLSTPASLPALKASHVQSPIHPTVVVIGDSIVNAWLPNPPSGWMVLGSPEGVIEETSTEVLARFPEAIALDPGAIVIEVGTWDVFETEFPDANGVCSDPGATCANIMAMVNQAEIAGIPIILGTLPPWGDGPAADGFYPTPTLDDLNQFILHYGGGSPGIMPQDPPIAPYPKGIYVVDYHAFLAIPGEDGQSDDFADSDGDIYVASYTNDGVLPNSVGAQIMTQATVTALSEVAK